MDDGWMNDGWMVERWVVEGWLTVQFCFPFRPTVPKVQELYQRSRKMGALKYSFLLVPKYSAER